MDLIASRTLNDKNEEKFKNSLQKLSLNLGDFKALKELSCIEDSNFKFTNKTKE